jgi:hypothetical protein
MAPASDGSQTVLQQELQNLTDIMGRLQYSRKASFLFHLLFKEYTTNVVGLNPTHSKVYSIQLYMIKFVSVLWQVDGFFSGYSGFLHQ